MIISSYEYIYLLNFYFKCQYTVWLHRFHACQNIKSYIYTFANEIEELEPFFFTYRSYPLKLVSLNDITLLQKVKLY